MLRLGLNFKPNLSSEHPVYWEFSNVYHDIFMTCLSQLEQAQSGAVVPLTQRVHQMRAYSSKTEVRAQASQAQVQMHHEADDAVPAHVNANR